MPLIVSQDKMRDYPTLARKPSKHTSEFIIVCPTKVSVTMGPSSRLGGGDYALPFPMYADEHLLQTPLFYEYMALMTDARFSFASHDEFASHFADTYSCSGGLITLCEPREKVSCSRVAPTIELVVVKRPAPTVEPVDAVRKYTVKRAIAQVFAVENVPAIAHNAPVALGEAVKKVTFLCPPQNREEVVVAHSGGSDFTLDAQYGPVTRLSYWDTSVACSKRTRTRRSRRRLQKARRSDGVACSQAVEPPIRDRSSPGFWQLPSRGKYKMLGRTSLDMLGKPARYSYAELISLHPDCDPQAIRNSPGFDLPLVKLRSIRI